MFQIHLSKIFRYISFNNKHLFSSIEHRLIQSTYRFLSSLSNYETLKVSQPKSHVTLVELNRPTKLNAMNKKLFE